MSEWNQLPSPSFATFNCVAGTEENNAQQVSKSVFPNPASGSITVAMDTKVKINKIRIVNTLGRQVFTGMSANEKEMIDVSGLPPGLYVISVNDKVYKKLQIAR